MFVRSPHNPLITPADVSPSDPQFAVIGTFNAGVTLFNDEVLMLVRVAERPAISEPGYVFCPYLSAEGEISLERIACDDPDYDTGDSRMVLHKPTRRLLLTSISHIRLARSRDGVTFAVDAQPWLIAQPPYESFGVEDARITCIDDTYYVNYTAVSEHGIATALVSTRDFVSVERHGVIFPPANRDVALFPERVNGQYVCYHRPMPAMLGRPNIWVAESPDLRHWGGHRLVLETAPEGWEAGRVGGGAPPVRTEHGWLSIYHAADRADRYCLGAFLTPLDDPGQVIARSREPILVPEEPYETDGFFSQVVFTCGVILQDGQLRVYYGAADERMCLAQAPLAAVLDTLTDQRVPV
jgi:beta-1,2-mannobiose phosphorylase / 1,2-beta-oligomannan phosphorylase